MNEQDPRALLLAQFPPDHSPLVEIGQRLGPDALEIVLQVLDKPKAYVPEVDVFWAGLERDARDARIVAEFRGDNLTELAEMFGLSRRRIRQILSVRTSRGRRE